MAGGLRNGKPGEKYETTNFHQVFGQSSMTYADSESCVKCKLTDCVEVCPVYCFYEGVNMLVIHPDECIDRASAYLNAPWRQSSQTLNRAWKSGQPSTRNTHESGQTSPRIKRHLVIPGTGKAFPTSSSCIFRRILGRETKSRVGSQQRRSSVGWRNMAL